MQTVTLVHPHVQAYVIHVTCTVDVVDSPTDMASSLLPDPSPNSPSSLPSSLPSPLWQPGKKNIHSTLANETEDCRTTSTCTCTCVCECREIPMGRYQPWTHTWSYSLVTKCPFDVARSITKSMRALQTTSEGTASPYTYMYTCMHSVMTFQETRGVL